ncbi:hypothetical protein WJX79_001677 [Trebouxia sp. C0005]
MVVRASCCHVAIALQEDFTLTYGRGIGLNKHYDVRQLSTTLASQKAQEAVTTSRPSSFKEMTSTAQAAAPDQLVGVPPTKTRVPIVVPEADATTATAVATADDTIPVGPPEPSPWAQKPQTPPNL